MLYLFLTKYKKIGANDYSESEIENIFEAPITSDLYNNFSQYFCLRKIYEDDEKSAFYYQKIISDFYIDDIIDWCKKEKSVFDDDTSYIKILESTIEIMRKYKRKLNTGKEGIFLAIG